MRFKKFLCALAAAVLCLTLPVTAYADTAADSYYSEEIVPMFVDDISAQVSIRISDSKATCECSARDYTSTIKSISVVMTLQKSGLFGIYSDVKNASWSKTVTGSTISLSGSQSDLADGTYRVKAVFTVTTTDGKTDTFTEYSSTAKAAVT